MENWPGLITYLVFDMPWGLALLLGAVITPTDPVVSSTIVSGKLAEKFLPSRIRQTISFESGANDGLAFPKATQITYIRADYVLNSIEKYIFLFSFTVSLDFHFFNSNGS